MRLVRVGQAVPAEPIIFNKAPNTVVGPYDDVIVPRGSTKTDWEVELGVVIAPTLPTPATKPRRKPQSQGTFW